MFYPASSLRVAYVSADDPLDPRSWSGTHNRIFQAVKQNVAEIVPVGPLDSRWRPVLDVVGKLSRHALGKRLASETSPLIARDHARQIANRLRGRQFDVILASAASGEVAHLETSLPIVYLSDATFAAMRGYYPRFAKMHSVSQAQADAMERVAIAKARRLVYPSAWAAQSAVRDYRADPERIAQIPFGANFDSAPPYCERTLAPSGGCRLLLVGKDWTRTGGPLAVEAVRLLRSRGLDARLTVVGCKRPAGVDDEAVEFIPSVDKRTIDGERKLQSLYREADIFILPTRAECLGVVFCEAAAYGLPIVGTATGGVPSVVVDGGNGVLLAPEAQATAYADAVEGIISTPGRYLGMSAESRRLYETRINWDAFGRRMADVLREAVLEAPRRN